MSGRSSARRGARAVALVLLGGAPGALGCRAEPAVEAIGTAAASPAAARAGSRPAEEADALSEIFAEPVAEVVTPALDRVRDLDAGRSATARARRGASPGDASESAVEAAVRELAALRKWLGFPRGLFFPLVLLAAWGVSRATQWGTRVVLRLGIEPRETIRTIGALLSISAWVGAVAIIMGRLLHVAPTLTLGVSVLTAAVAAFVLRRPLENLAAGIGLAVRSRLREGDRIVVGEHQGVVRRVGFTRIELKQADGSRLYVPNRLVSTAAVTIGPARYSVPLDVTLSRDRPWTAEEIRWARRLAGLSPYRDPHGRIVVETEGDTEHRLSVQLQVWSPRLRTAAEEHLRRQLDLYVARPARHEGDGERRQGERRAGERRGL